MSLIPEILGKNGSLLERVLYPSMFSSSPQAEPAPPPPQAPPAASAATAPRPGLRGILESIFAGPSDPRLTDQQNQQAASQSLIQGGLATISAASQPGASALGSVAEGAMFGQKARAANSEIIYGRTQAERVQNALNNPELMKLLTPAQRAAIAMMSPADAMEAISKLAFTPAQLAAPGTAGFDAFGKRVFLNPAEPKPANVSSPMKDAMAKYGINSIEAYDTAPAAIRAAVDAQTEKNRKASAASNTFNVDTATAKGINAADLDEYKDMRTKAREARGTLDSLDLLSQLMDQHPEGLTGGASELLLNARSLLTNMGMSPEAVKKVSDQQTFVKAANEVMFSKVKALGGRILQSEIRLMQKTVANLANTPDANKVVIEVGKRNAQRLIDHAALANQWLADHNQSLAGIDKAIDDFDAAHPIYEGVLESVYGKKAPE